MIFRKTNSLAKIANSSIIDLPAPINLSVNWNYGSILLLILMVQIVSGMFLAMRYSGHVLMAFDSVVSIGQDSDYGWLLRLMHSTGASFFFLFLYLHMGRGIYYGSSSKTLLWNIGVVIYLILMGTAFLGYVLPWGQMSYWAATVITNLLSAIPVFGDSVVKWVWGGFAVSNPTLTRFFTLHFFLPFLVLGLAVLHVYYLHLYSSSNPLGLDSTVNKVSFHYFYTVKDSLFLALFFGVLIWFSCMYGYDFMDPENFIPANILVTPTHIQPEWYFLFAYAILRAVPNKLGGVLALLSSVLILFLLSVKPQTTLFSGLMFNPISRMLFWMFVSTFFCLTWLGSCPAEPPYIMVAIIMSSLYFILVITLSAMPHLFSHFYIK